MSVTGESTDANRCHDTVRSPVFKTNRREFLKLTRTSATMSLLAGCSEANRSQQTPTDTPTPTYSYKAITGTWSGSTYPEDSPQYEHSHAKLEILKEGATLGEEVGALKLLVEKGGEVHCESTLTAQDSDPPTTFWLNVEATDYPCSSHIRYRFQPATPNKLEWYITYDGESYRRVDDLSR